MPFLPFALYTDVLLWLLLELYLRPYDSRRDNLLSAFLLGSAMLSYWLALVDVADEEGTVFNRSGFGAILTSLNFVTVAVWLACVAAPSRHG